MLMKWMVFLSVLVIGAPALAFKNQAFYAGIGYFAQNSFNKVATKPTGDAGFFGPHSYPLNVKYDFSIGSDWYMATRFSYTPLPRSSAGDSAKTTMMHLYFPVGRNFASVSNSSWEWFVGPGLIRYSIQGAGGTTVLSNGTGTATFGLPSKSATIQNVTLNTGVGWNVDLLRVGMDLIFEGALSSKRSANILFSLDYRFSGGF